MNILPPLVRIAAALASVATLSIACAVLPGCAEADKLWKIDGMTPTEFLEDDKRRRAEGRPTLRQEKEQQTAAGQPGTGPAASTGGAPTQGKRTCHKVQYSGKANVDTAYIRTMQNFPFRTLDQIDHQYAYYDRTVRHNKTPGVMYDLSDGVIIDGQSSKRVVVEMDLRLAKSGAGSSVSSNFCLNASDSENANLIEQKIRNLVR
jgi:hypothetical protein